MTDDPTFFHHKKSEGRLSWRITPEILRTIARDVPPQEFPVGRVFLLALTFLKYVFGQSWIEENLEPTTDRTGFIHPDLSGMHEEKLQIHF
jgi:hypothetical protein